MGLAPTRRARRLRAGDGSARSVPLDSPPGEAVHRPGSRRLSTLEARGRRVGAPLIQLEARAYPPGSRAYPAGDPRSFNRRPVLIQPGPRSLTRRPARIRLQDSSDRAEARAPPSSLGGFAAWRLSLSSSRIATGD